MDTVETFQETEQTESRWLKGRIFPTLIRFSLPFLLSNFLQTLYGLADLYIIGQYNPASSTTAVAIGSQVMHMVTVMLVGLAMGSTVLIGQALGAGKKKEAAGAIGNTILLFMTISLVLTVLLLFCTDGIVALLSTPQQAIEGTRIYLWICFAGIPFICAYNIASSIYRGLGDSLSPMIFVAIACIINVAADYLFIGQFHLDTAGAALGTVLSQSISMLIAFGMLFSKSRISLTRESFRLDRKLMSALLKIGIPVSLQDGLIQVSFLVITVIANLRGLNEAAAVGVVEKIIGILFLVPSAMLATVSALAAINIGAHQFDRAKQILKGAIVLAIGFGILSTLVMQFFAEAVVGLFVHEQIVITMGSQYLRGYVFDCMVAGIHFCFSGYFCAYGYSMLPFISNVVSVFIARIPLAYLASILYQSLFPMGLAITAGSLVSVVISLIAYQWLNRKKAKALI